MRGDGVAERVLQFYGNLGHNSGAPYGVTTETLRRATPFRETLCDDWLVVARMAAMGKVRTIRTTRLHKSMGGVSGDIYGFARASGLGHWRARFHFLSATFLVAADIRSHPAFSPVPSMQRWRLSFTAQARVLRRIAVDQAVHRARLGALSSLRACLGAERLGRRRARYQRRPWRKPAIQSPTSGLAARPEGSHRDAHAKEVGEAQNGLRALRRRRAPQRRPGRRPGGSFAAISRPGARCTGPASVRRQGRRGPAARTGARRAGSRAHRRRHLEPRCVEPSGEGAGGEPARPHVRAGRSGRREVVRP